MGSSTRLSREFFERDTLTVARELLGQILVRTHEGWRLAGRIVEAEAYIGRGDSACHASKGRTPRTEVMFGPPGHAYVYFIYGMHHCMNIVTEPDGCAAAVLIRALEPMEGLVQMRMLRSNRPDRQLTNGPGKLCQAMEISRDQNGLDITTSDLLFVETGQCLADDQVATSPRINVSGDEFAVTAAWRFFVKGNPYVSR